LFKNLYRDALAITVAKKDMARIMQKIIVEEVFFNTLLSLRKKP
jgi:hypothetical protein